MEKLHRHNHGAGITRRELLQVGYSGLLGIGVPSIWAGQASGSVVRHRNPAQNRSY